MIDELYKDRMDLFWDHFGRWVARTGLTPNHVTWLGIALCSINAGAFLAHRNMLVFGLLVGLIELLDNVDGAVARVTGQSSKLGSYLDAATDRYKDFFILLAIASVTGYWLPCMIALAGSLITSYNAARAAMLGATDDGDSGGLPDLFERFERIATLVVGLALNAWVPLIAGHDLLFYVVWGVAIMTQLTALQRFARRARQLEKLDAQD
jgi:phosphatidylglycerophosphate synthase